MCTSRTTKQPSRSAQRPYLRRVIATRGERLALAHVRSVNRGMSGQVGAEMLGIVEIDADDRIVAGVIFDLDDIDAAFESLTPATSPAKRLSTRIRGRSSHGSAPPSTGTSYRRDHGLGQHRPPAARTDRGE